MNRSFAALLSVVLAGSAWAQPTPPTPPPTPPTDERENGNGTANGGLPVHDRPLMRALAYERRDVVAEILERPTSLSAASAVELATDIGVPKPHAEMIVAGAQGGRPLNNLIDILKLGVPTGVTLPANLNLATATEAQLKTGGMSAAQAKEFANFRRSAKRVHTHFREVRAIAEAKAAGERMASTATREFLSASTAEKVKMLARGMGLSAPEAEREARLTPEERRRRAVEGTAEGTRDAFAGHRRADGSIKWAEFARSQTFSGASGMAHFAFAMFLKELALTLHSGDRTRLEDFVNGLMSTDFFVNYGLFAAGASTADVAYGKFVRRVTRKHFLSGVLRSNIVLAAGLAVPMIARGQFSLDTYLVDVAALGLSATAVKAAVEGVSGVYRLVRGGRTAINLGRLATPVGWVYSAGEAAVVLLLSDQVATRLDRWLDDRAVRKKLQDAQKVLEDIKRRVDAGQPVDEAVLTAALTELEDAYDASRKLKARPLEDRLGRFRGELDAAGRRAHMDDTGLNALRSALDRNAALKANVIRRFGSVEAYMAHMEGERNAPLEARLRDESAAFDRDWANLVEETYVGANDGDPAPNPGTRLASYDEETEHLLAALDGTSDPEARRLIALAIERVRRGRAADRDVYEAGRGAPTPLGDATGTAPPTTTPTPTGGSADTDGMTNALRREVGLPPAAGGETVAPTPVAPVGDVAPVATATGPSFDEGLPGRMVDFGRAPLADEGTGDSEAPAPELVTDVAPIESSAPLTPTRPVRRVRAPLGDEGTADTSAGDTAVAPIESRAPVRAPIAEEGTADAEAAPTLPPEQGTLPMPPEQGTLPPEQGTRQQGQLPATQPEQGLPLPLPPRGGK